MTLPGLLIEYFVIGSLALLWAVPWIDDAFVGAAVPSDYKFFTDSKNYQILLVPLAYVLGIAVNAIGALITSFPRNASLKRLLREPVEIGFRTQLIMNGLSHEAAEDRLAKNPYIAGYVLGKKNKGRSGSAIIHVKKDLKEISGEIELRDSQGRIIRGTTLNLFFFMVSEYIQHSVLNQGLLQINNMWLVLPIILFAGLWCLADRKNYRFELQVGEMILEVTDDQASVEPS